MTMEAWAGVTHRGPRNTTDCLGQGVLERGGTLPRRPGRGAAYTPFISDFWPPDCEGRGLAAGTT